MKFTTTMYNTLVTSQQAIVVAESDIPSHDHGKQEVQGNTNHVNLQAFLVEIFQPSWQISTVSVIFIFIILVHLNRFGMTSLPDPIRCSS